MVRRDSTEFLQGWFHQFTSLRHFLFLIPKLQSTQDMEIICTENQGVCGSY